MHPALGVIVLLVVGLALALSVLTVYVGWRLRHPPRKTYGRAVARGLPGDPGELGIDRPWEDYELRLTGDWQRGSRGYAAPVWSITGDDPEGPVVISTMGWADSRIGTLVRLGGWEAATLGLATRASRVIAWDPPGQGEGPGPSPLGTAEPAMVVELVKHAVEQWGGAERGIVLTGSSLGAGVSVVAASIADAPLRDSIVGVVAEAPYRVPVPPAHNVVTGAGYPGFTLHVLYRYFGLRLGVGINETWPKAHAGIGFDRALHAARLACPLLVVHGDRDKVSPFADGEAMALAAEQHGAGGRLLHLPDAGHNNLWVDERFAATIGREVAEFIGTLQRPPFAPNPDQAAIAEAPARGSAG